MVKRVQSQATSLNVASKTDHFQHEPTTGTQHVPTCPNSGRTRKHVPPNNASCVEMLRSFGRSFGRISYANNAAENENVQFGRAFVTQNFRLAFRPRLHNARLTSEFETRTPFSCQGLVWTVCLKNCVPKFLQRSVDETLECQKVIQNSGS